MADERAPRRHPGRASHANRWIQGEKPWWVPGWPSIRDIVTSIIALGLLKYVGDAMLPLLSSGTDEGMRLAREAFAILGTAVGAVLGFYFGAGAGERIARQATQQATDAAEGRAISEERLLALRSEVHAKVSTVEERQERQAALLAELLDALKDDPDAEDTGDEVSTADGVRFQSRDSVGPDR